MRTNTCFYGVFGGPTVAQVDRQRALATAGSSGCVNNTPAFAHATFSVADFQSTS